MRRVFFLVTLLGSLAAFGADKPPEWIEGRVVDEAGRPVVDADVSTFWSANGWKLSPDDNKRTSFTEEEARAQWTNIGRMEPLGKPARTAADGSFRVAKPGRTNHVLAMDAARQRGGLGILPLGPSVQPITIPLERLVRVQGEIRGPGPGQKPSWTHVYTERAEEPERPIDFYRIASCGSYNADFAMLLPPGRYRFQAYDDEFRGEVAPYPELTITGTEGTVDLGTWLLTPQREALVPHLNRVRAETHGLALKDRIGQAPPALFADDAQGVPRDWQAGRAPGKWQVIEFWGMGCAPCLGRSIPELMAFRERHAAQADRFEIVTVFIDDDEKIRTVAQMDEALRPIVQHVWGGQSLTLPTLVDPSYRSAESFGIGGLGELVLISPEGKIVAGDLATLAKALDAN